MQILLEAAAARDAALSGLKDITHLTILHQLNELTYLAAGSQHQSQKADDTVAKVSGRFESLLVNLYQKFIEYQLQLWHAYRGNRLKRFAKDLAQPGVWKGKVEDMRKIDSQLRDAMRTLDGRVIEDIPSKLDERLDQDIVAVFNETSSVPSYPEATSGGCFKLVM